MPNEPNDGTWTSYSGYSIGTPIRYATGSVIYFHETRDPIEDLLANANLGIECIKKLSKEHKDKFRIVNGKFIKKENT